MLDKENQVVDEAKLSTQIDNDKKAQSKKEDEVKFDAINALPYKGEDEGGDDDYYAIADDFMYNLFVIDGEISQHKDDNDKAFISTYRGFDFSLKEKDYYLKQDIFKEKYGENIKKFNSDYDRALHLQNVLKGVDVSESFQNETNEIDASLDDAFAGYGSKFRGEESDDSIDLQKASTLMYEDEFGNLNLLDDETKEDYDFNFKRKQGALSTEAYDRTRLYVEPFKHGDELIGYEAVSKWDLDTDGVFNMQKESLSAIEYTKFLPKTFNNSVIGVINGVADALQSSIFNNPDSESYKDLQDMKNLLNTYKIGSSTSAQLESPMQNFEALVDTSLNVFGQVAVASGVAFLTRSLGPSISNMAARMVYTATVLDGTRKEALDNGMSHDAADIYTMASALGFLTASKEAVSFSRAVMDEGVKRSITKKAIEFGTNLGRKTAKLYNKAIKSNIMVEGFVSEAGEEMTEEIFQEASRQIANFYEASNKEAYPTFDVGKGRFATFGDKDYIANVASNVGTAGVLGGLGGAVMGGAKSIMTWKIKDVPKEELKNYSSIIRQGREKEFVENLNKQYDKGLLGSKKLSFKENSKGKYEVAESEEDSQAMFNYQLILNNLSTVKEALGDVGRMIEDPNFVEGNYLLKERSQELVNDIMDIYSANDLKYSDIKAMKEMGLAEYNSKYSREITQETLDKATNINKKLEDIKKGREHVHFFIKDKIKEDSVFGDENFREDKYKGNGEYFYETTLGTLGKSRDISNENSDRLIKLASINNLEIDEFIEAHSDRPIESIESFTQNGVLLLSKESVKKIMAHNELFYKDGAGELLSKYKSSNPLTVPGLVNIMQEGDGDILRSTDFDLLIDNRLAEVAKLVMESPDNETIKKEFDILTEYKNRPKGTIVNYDALVNYLSGVNPDLSSEINAVLKHDYKSLSDSIVESFAQAVYDDNISVLENVKETSNVPDEAFKEVNIMDMDAIYSTKVLNYIKTKLESVNENGEVPVLLSEQIKQFVALDSEHKKGLLSLDLNEEVVVSKLSADEFKQLLDEDIYNINVRIASMPTADDVSSAVFGENAYLNSIISNGQFTSNHFHEPVDQVIKSFSESEVDGVYTWGDLPKLESLMDDITATNRFFLLSASNLEFLGKLQRIISNNTSGGKISYEQYNTGADPELGVINDLMTKPLYDVERIDFLERTGQTESDEYRQAMSVLKAIRFDDKKIGDILEFINSPYQFIKDKQNKGEVLTKIEADWMSNYQLDIASINADTSLDDEAKAQQLEQRKFTNIDEKLEILSIINKGNDYTITEKHRVTIAILDSLKKYIESQKDNLHLVDYNGELKSTLKKKFKSLYKILKSIKSETCK